MILLHPLLFAVYPVLFLYAQNVGETPVSDIILPVIFALLLCLSFFLIAKILFKDTQKAGFLTSVFLILFFSYGHLFDFLRTTPVDKIIQGRHVFVYPIYIFVFFITVYKTGKSKRSFKHFTRILNTTSGILTIVPLFIIASFFINNTIGRLPVAEISSGVKFDSTKVLEKESLPDIYYIILDRYGREDTLKRIYNYDNTGFLSVLAEKGFYIAPNSRANYTDTTHSLASSLNMTHLDYLNTLGERNYIDWSLLNNKVSNNEVLALLKTSGYETIQFGSWWEQSRVNRYADVNINTDTIPGFHHLVLEKTMLHPIRVKMGLVDDSLEEQWKREQMKFKKLKEIVRQKGPKFVFAHFLITHEPYTFKADGSFLDADSQKDMSGEEKYLEGLKFTNTETLEFVDYILQDKEKYDPIIIIQADEGPYPGRISENHKNFDWATATNEEVVEKMGILNTYYLPEGGNRFLYPSISPVNTFRVIFNYYFNQNYQILRDDSFLSNMSKPYVFIPVHL